MKTFSSPDIIDQLITLDTAFKEHTRDVHGGAAAAAPQPRWR
jgi:hypothetical protein